MPHIVVASSVVLAVACSATVSPASNIGSVSVDVPQPTSVQSKVRISFRPVRLPRDGYYYAVLVLDRYLHYSQKEPPPCAISSEMKMTEYGYPRAGRVRLALAPARSTVGHWCPGGTYIGGVYAVPHKPSCSSYYPCYGNTRRNSACWELEGGRTVCGVTAIPLYSYPGGLPKPLDPSTRIVGHFKVHF